LEVVDKTPTPFGSKLSGLQRICHRSAECGVANPPHEAKDLAL